MPNSSYIGVISVPHSSRGMPTVAKMLQYCRLPICYLSSFELPAPLRARVCFVRFQRCDNTTSTP